MKLVLLGLASLLALAPQAAAAQRGTSSAIGALTFEAELASAPYPIAGTPNVGVHVPAGFDARSALHLVIYVHGLRGCLPVLLGKGETRCDRSSAPEPGWDLGARHDAADTNSVFVVPRLIYGKRGGQPGAFAKPGGFRAFLLELLRGPLSNRLGRVYTIGDVASVTLLAHSAGYETTLAILEHGGVDALVRTVVLFDALYALEERYARYARARADDGLRLIVIHLRGGRPERAGRKLQQRLVRELGEQRVRSAGASDLSAAIASHAFVFARGRGPHRQVPEHHIAEVLGALKLPAR